MTDAPLNDGPMAPHALKFRRHVVVEREVARFGDVADLSGLPAPLRLAAQSIPVVMAERAPRRSVAITSIATRVRTAMPALYPWLANPPAGQVDIAFTQPVAAAASKAPVRPGCVTLQRAIPAGEIVNLEDVIRTDCQPGASPKALTYEAASGLARARRALQAGENVGPVSLSVLAGFKADQPVALRSNVGAVSIERQARVIRSARKGGKVIVRTASRQAVLVDQGDLAPW